MKTQFTKGEWLIEKSGLTEMQYDIDTNDNSTLIARVGTIEDAKLIAAAPDMFEILRMIYEFSRDENCIINKEMPFYELIENSIKKATE